MAQKDKELLLKDLCARLPYRVKVFYKYKMWDSEKFATSIRLADGKIALSNKLEKEGDWFPIEEAMEILIKPYLRPMSSITKEEEEEWWEFENKNTIVESHLYSVDWLNAHHFDYRGLIEKGLALKAPEGMYEY